MKFKQFLSESINDKNLLKAVILAGGPGSGKSFIAEIMFKGDAKFVASDDPFEMLLDKAGLPKKLNPDNVEIYNLQWIERTKAKKLTTTQMYHYINGMLPIVIDGTGKSIEKVTKQKQELEKLGYDVSLIFVNTNLEVSMDRNRKRERSIDDAETKKLWNQVQKNIGHFNSLFKNDFIVVDNNELLEGKPLEKLKLRLSKVAMKMLNTPLKNHKGKSLIKTLKDNKMKYMSDLVDIEKKLKI
jgi:dephospho-CoA kinase